MITPSSWYNVDMDGNYDGRWSVQPSADPMMSRCLEQLISPAARIHGLLMGASHWIPRTDRQQTNYVMTLVWSEQNLGAAKELSARLDQLLEQDKKICVSGVFNPHRTSLYLSFVHGGTFQGSVLISLRLDESGVV